MKAKHTTGPWFVDESKGPVIGGTIKATIGVWAQKRFNDALRSDDEKIEPEDEKWLCGAWGVLSDEDFANANLIAAAPDLLEALELAWDYMSFHDGEYDCQDQLQKMQFAIAKATGKA